MYYDCRLFWAASLTPDESESDDGASYVPNPAIILDVAAETTIWPISLALGAVASIDEDFMSSV